MKNRLFVILAAIILCVGSAGIADAHTTSIGFVPGALPGQVNFWTGSYHSSHSGNEGTLTVTGIAGTIFGPSTLPFNIGPVGSKPAGLIDGTNNFYWGGPSGAGATFPHNADQGIGGGVKIWQSVLFSGLNPGNYSFSCGATCGTSVVWRSWGPGTVQLALQGRDIGGGGTNGNVIPEPATMALLGSGLFGMVGFRRKKA